LLPRKKDTGRMPALLDFPSLGDILRRAEAARISPSVRMAHRLCAFTAMRIGNVVDAEWREFHLDDAQPVWIIPRKKMKVTTRDIDHRVPLSPEINDELRRWREMFGGKGFVFPSPQGGKHIGRESIEKVYRVTLGLSGKHSPHGWRSAFSTLAAIMVLRATWWSLPWIMPTTTKSREPMIVVSGLMSESNYLTGG
jgi:integrase